MTVLGVREYAGKATVEVSNDVLGLAFDARKTGVGASVVWLDGEVCANGL